MSRHNSMDEAHADLKDMKLVKSLMPSFVRMNGSKDDLLQKMLESQGQNHKKKMTFDSYQIWTEHSIIDGLL